MNGIRALLTTAAQTQSSEGSRPRSSCLVDLRSSRKQWTTLQLMKVQESVSIQRRTERMAAREAHRLLRKVIRILVRISAVKGHMVPPVFLRRRNHLFSSKACTLNEYVPPCATVNYNTHWRPLAKFAWRQSKEWSQMSIRFSLSSFLKATVHVLRFTATPSIYPINHGSNTRLTSMM